MAELLDVYHDYRLGVRIEEMDQAISELVRLKQSIYYLPLGD